MINEKRKGAPALTTSRGRRVSHLHLTKQRGIGEYMGGDKLGWSKGLKSKTIRRMIADCFKIVCDYDDYMLDVLKEFIDI